MYEKEKRNQVVEAFKGDLSALYKKYGMVLSTQKGSYGTEICISPLSYRSQIMVIKCMEYVG